MIDVCVIGYGYWGPNLCRNFSNTEGYNLASICDLNNQNLLTAKKNYPNVKNYTDFKQAILENDFQLIVLATPTSTHYNQAKFILNKSINLLVEKPLCLSIKEHINLNKIAKKNNVNIFIDYPFIYSGTIKYLKNVITRKKFGKLRSIESYREQAPIRTDTNVLWDLSIHDISIISYLLDIKKMEEAAQILSGEHDFSAFRAANCSSPSPRKNLHEILISKKRFRYSTLQIEFEANSFLQHMVRIISGTLVEVGQGRKSVDDVAEALESGQRKLAGITAPGHGLYSLSVIYPQGMIKWPKEVIDN